MKIATYNVNGVNGRLPVLLRWLRESAPDVVCLQELKAPQEKFPEQAIVEAGYQCIYLLFCIIYCKRCSCGAGYAKLIHQWLGAVVACSYSNALVI